MASLLRVLHLLALGMWFGSVAFFSFFTALPIIRTMEAHAEKGDHWLELKEKRTGTRLAGDALTPVFARYFPVQVICGALALCTTPWWSRAMPRFAGPRRVLILAGFLLACLNTFVFAPRVSDLRRDRYSADSEVAVSAERAFGPWHTYSLLTDLTGLASVTAALALAALGRRDESPSTVAT